MNDLENAILQADERGMSLTAAQREQLFKAGLGGGRGGGTGGGTVLRAHTYMADQYKQVRPLQRLFLLHTSPDCVLWATRLVLRMALSWAHKVLLRDPCGQYLAYNGIQKGGLQ